MKADDVRHGTRAGYYAHRKHDQPACDRCKRAAAAAQARYDHNRDHGIPGRVSPLGTQRRLQALIALGYTWTNLDAHLGNRMAEKFGSERLTYVFPSTHAKIFALYESLRDTMPPQTTSKERGAVTKAKRMAARRGWAAPDRWYDIDDPNERPDPGYDDYRNQQDKSVDAVVVDRILSGDMTLARSATKAERVEVVARWRADGRALNELERLTGWEPRRYRREVA